MLVHSSYLQWSDPSAWILTAAGDVRDLKGLASPAQECGLGISVSVLLRCLTSESLGSQRSPYLERDREGNLILTCNCHFLKNVLIFSSCYIQFLLVLFAKSFMYSQSMLSVPLGRMYFAGEKKKSPFIAEQKSH